MEKRSLFKRVTALLCCIMMLVTTVPVYAATGPTASMDISAYSDKITFYTDFGMALTSDLPWGTNYKLSLSGNVITFTALDGLGWEESNEVSIAGKTIVLYATTTDDSMVKITNSRGKATTEAVKPDDQAPADAEWKITLEFMNFPAQLGNPSLSVQLIETPKEKVTVNFSSADSNCFIRVREGENSWKMIGISGDYSVDQGNNVSFKLTKMNGEDADQSKDYTVFADGNPLAHQDGIYTIENVQANTSVLVYSATKEFTVTLPESTAAYTITGDEKVSYGTAYTFYVTPADGYDAPAVQYQIGTADAVPLASVGSNTYRINGAQVKDNITITVGEASKNRFTITAPANDGEGFVYQSETTTVNKGGALTFYVSPKDGYQKPTVEYTMGAGERKTLTSGANDRYVINNITGDITIYVTPGLATTYSVHFTTGTGYTVTMEGGSTEIAYGTEKKFTVTLDSGYEIVAVRANSSRLTAGTDGKYSVKVTGDVEVEVTVRKITYSVTYSYTPDPSFTLTKGDDTAVHGSSYSFTVEPKDGYNAPKVEYSFVENGTYTELTGNSSNRYTIDNITANTYIRITAGTQKTYTVNLINNAPVTFEVVSGTPASVTHGGSIKFKVNIANEELYDITKLEVRDGSTVIYPDSDGNYTITDIQANKTVTVNALPKLTYTVSFGTTGEGYTLIANSGTNTVAAGEDFKFTLSLSSGFQEGTDFSVRAGSVVLTGVDGVYTIEKVTADTVITVSGVERITYTPDIKVDVDYPNGTHATVVGTESDTISYNGTFKFSVTASAYYTVTKVTVDGNEVFANDGTYTISNVTKIPVIRVTTRENELTVHFTSDVRNHEYEKDDVLTAGTIRTYTDNKHNEPNVHEKCPVHVFNGWFNGDNAATQTYLLNLIKGGDAEVTLTAEYGFSVNATEYMLNVYMSDTRATRTGASGGYSDSVTFRTYVGLGNTIDPCVDELTEVTAAGTLLSNNSSALNMEIQGVKDAISKELETQLGKTENREKTSYVAQRYTVSGNTLYNYYYILDGLTLTQVNGNYSELKINSNNPDSLYAAGWIECDINNGQKKVYVLATQQGSLARKPDDSSDGE